MSATIRTKTGCKVGVHDGAHWPHLEGEHGPGVMLTLDMDQPGDGRHSEAYVDLDAAIALHQALEDWIMRR